MNDILGVLIHRFFTDYLVIQRGRATLTVKSYRDTFRLLLRFLSTTRRRAVTALTVEDLSKDRVLEFLRFLETERGNAAQTRNQRLAALHSFFEFVASEDPTRLFQAQRIAAIPTKRAEVPPARYIPRDLLAQFMRTLPKAGRLAARDRALLLFLYNTGARAQEVASAETEDVNLSTRIVCVRGKRNKERLLVLWDATAAALRHLLASYPRADGVRAPLFRSQRGGPLTRGGIYRLVRRHASRLEAVSPAARRLHFTPHLFRHTMAVHRLEAKVDLRTIQTELGHARVTTTSRYANVTIGMREAAMRATEPDAADFGSSRKPVWKSEPELLRWLDSL